MDASSSKPSRRQSLSKESLSYLAEGVRLVFSRWTGLQMAIQNEWGGRDSHSKSFQLESEIMAWFIHSKDSHYIDELEDILDEAMVNYFNAEFDDGSIEEVAEKLMIIHEGCLQGNYDFVEKLRKSNLGLNSVPQSRQVCGQNASESSDEDESPMNFDEFKAMGIGS